MAGRATHGLPGRPWRRTSCSMSGISHLSAAVTVDRAGHELRRGRPVLLTLGQGVEQQRALVLAAETLTEDRSEEHTSELQSLMRISYAVFCLQKKKNKRY